MSLPAYLLLVRGGNCNRPCPSLPDDLGAHEEGAKIWSCCGAARDHTFYAVQVFAMNALCASMPCPGRMDHTVMHVCVVAVLLSATQQQ